MYDRYTFYTHGHTYSKRPINSVEARQEATTEAKWTGHSVQYRCVDHARYSDIEIVVSVHPDGTANYHEIVIDPRVQALCL